MKNIPYLATLAFELEMMKIEYEAFQSWGWFLGPTVFQKK